MDNRLPEDFVERLKSVKSKRARLVIEIILEKGQCSTEDLARAGYGHAPRAARDVREAGIPLITEKGKDSEGRNIAVYRFGDWEEAKKENKVSKASGRGQLTSALKKKLIAEHGAKCNLFNEEYPERLLQVDHRVPYEIGGDPVDMQDTAHFMLLCPSANRDKSWACEHCMNLTAKDVDVCRRCYYASPDDYDHIAGVPEKRITLIFKGGDVKLYSEIVSIGKKKGIGIQDTVKELLRIAMADSDSDK